MLFKQTFVREFVMQTQALLQNFENSAPVGGEYNGVF
jgi:hypothetical protein